MGYINAADVLPAELISRIQEYVDGQILYIPRKPEEHTGWGVASGIRGELVKRDAMIFDDYRAGKNIAQLADVYCLSVKSIQRIIHKESLRN